MAYVIWGLGGVAAILLFALIFIQRRTGKRLKGELAELAKIRQGNVEYEFILKAMKLSTWQMDPRRRMITPESLTIMRKPPSSTKVRALA